MTSGRVSGVDVFALHLTRGLMARGVPARILLTDPGEPVSDRLPLASDVPVDTLPAVKGEKGRDRRRRLREYLVARAPCVYLPNYDYSHSSVCAHLPPNVLTVGIVHSDDPMHYDHARRLGRYWDAVVAVSDLVGRRTLAVNRGLAGRLSVIPYGVVPAINCPPRHRSPDQPLRVLYAGRLEHAQKRVLDLVRILDCAADRGVSIQLTVVGLGDAKEDVERAGRRRLQDGTLRLLGAVPNVEMTDLYRGADCFLLTSAFEGMPVSLLEAMGQGCVPVVTDVESGVPELIRDGINGFLLPVGDIFGFCRRLEELKHDTEMTQRLSIAAHGSIIKGGYTVERMVGAYESVFAQARVAMTEGRFHRPKAWPGVDALGRLYFRLERKWRRWVTPLLSHSARPGGFLL